MVNQQCTQFWQLFDIQLWNGKEDRSEHNTNRKQKWALNWAAHWSAKLHAQEIFPESRNSVSGSPP